MKNWKPAYRIAAISCGSAIFIGIITGALNKGDFALVLGIVCLVAAIIFLALGLIILLAGSKGVGKGLLLSAGILLLLSGVSCSIGFSSVNFH